MADRWSGVMDYHHLTGYPIRIKCDFLGFEKESVSIAYGSKVFDADSYVLTDGGGFILWQYLINPTEFKLTTHNRCASFVISMDCARSSESIAGGKVDILLLTLAVNDVPAMDNSGGHKVNQRTFTLKFHRRG